MSTQESLEERYGGSPAYRRRLLVAASVVLAVVFCGWVVWTIYERTTATEVTSELEGFSVIDGSTVSAVLIVSLADDDVEASCRLRAFAEDHTTVGELAFTPDPGAGRRQVVEIRTDRRATSVESLGCTAGSQKRPR